MADTIREKAMQAMKTLLLAVPGMANVYREATDGPSEPDYPHVIMDEGTDSPAETRPEAPHGKATHLLSMTLEVWISGPDNPYQRLNNLVGEVWKKLKTKPNYQLGGWAIWTKITTIRTQVNRSAQFNSAFLTVEVLYRHALDDPFNL